LAKTRLVYFTKIDLLFPPPGFPQNSSSKCGKYEVNGERQKLKKLSIPILEIFALAHCIFCQECTKFITKKDIGVKELKG
jgi:hypothetical protein